MNDNYTPLYKDYFRTVILGVMYTVISQLWKLVTFQLNNKLYSSRAWNHIYWVSISALKYLVIMILLYPQIDEISTPSRPWNISASQILTFGTTITVSEWLIKSIAKHMRQSLLFNFYNRPEFEGYKKSIDNNQLRRNSSITLIYKMKLDLKEKQIHQRYYGSDEESHDDQLDSNEGQTLVLDPDSGSKIVSSSTASIGFGGGFGGHIDLPNGDSFHAGVGGGFEYGRKKSPRSSSKSSTHYSTASKSGRKNSSIFSVANQQEMEKWLTVIGILNVPEYVLNVEIPILAKKDLFLSNEYYDLLVNSKLFALSMVWSMDSLILNLFECLAIATVFLYKVSSIYAPLIVISLTAFRLLMYEIWRYFLLVRFTQEREKVEFSNNYGAIAEVGRGYEGYFYRCMCLSYIFLIVDIIALGSISFFIES